MTFLPDERNAELRALFFESAAELLQNINDSGLQLEKHPGDEEALRSLRRAVHTLKGDSAACGFSKLSELAHEFEDVLTLRISQTQGAQLAEAILSAVDTFENMLSCYQRQIDAPAPGELRLLIRRLLESPSGSDCQTSLRELSHPGRIRVERIRTADDLRSTLERKQHL